MILSKKGAIEMSMQTIIIIVIGVTLLTLGLRFVYTTFSDIGGQQEKVSDLTEKQLLDLFGESEEVIYLPRDQISVEQGETENLDVIIKNSGSKDGIKFAYEVNAVDAPGDMELSSVSDWFVWNQIGKTLNSGKGYQEKLLIRVPQNARLGTYLISLEMTTCGDPEICDPFPESQLILEVTS